MVAQTALALTEVGKPLTLITLPIPEPKENEALIKIVAAGITPLDQKLRDLGLFNIGSRLPAVLVYDLVGTVVKYGPNTSSTFPLGSTVMSQATTVHIKSLAGGLQEYTIINTHFAAIIPKNISSTDAAQFPINAFTSASTLFTSNGPFAGFGIPFPGTIESKTFDYKSQKLVIIGGGTACGKFAIQFARIAGIGTIITTASLSNEDELRSYGATHVLDRRAPDLGAQIRALVGDDLIYLYDTFNSGDHSFNVSLLSSSKKGTLAHLCNGKVDKAIAAQKKAGYEERQMNGSSENHPELAVLFWKMFPEWVEKGEIKVLPYKVIEGLDAEKVNAVLDGYRDGKAAKWIVRL